MVERRCVRCDKKVDLPHVRVWEEDVKISRMLTFCSYKCLWLWLTTDIGTFVGDAVT